jgi:hypothetical protein
MKKNFLGFIFFTNVYASDVIKLPSPEMQKSIFKAIRNEMIRLDGEGLIARRDRPLDFIQTTNNLLNESIQENNILDFYSLFKRLDATYTNLHSKLILNEQMFESVNSLLNNTTMIGTFSEVTPGKKTRLLVTYIDDIDLRGIINEGDEIVKINGRTVESWLDENFIFCKQPLRNQCDHDFENNLLKLNLSWKKTKLTYSIKHLEKIIDVDVKFFKPKNNSDVE